MFAPVPVPKSPINSTKLKKDLYSKGSSGVSGVLKYFRQKKVSPVQEEEYHQFRIMQNRLMQWRFANARAEASATAVKRIAQMKLFNVWLRICTIRNMVVEKVTQIHKLNLEIKLCRIVFPQVCLLKEWSRLETKNCEAVGRLERKLSAISVCLPVVQGAKADVDSFIDEISMALKVMEITESVISDSQVEEICYLLTELSIVVKEQKEYASKLEKCLAMVVKLEAAERSLRLQFMQLAEESRRRIEEIKTQQNIIGNIRINSFKLINTKPRSYRPGTMED